MPESKSQEIRFWWPIPLAAIIWLVIIWEFGYFLKSPKEEIISSPPIDARFVELPDTQPEQESSPPKSSPQNQPEPELKPKLEPKPEPTHEPPPTPQPRAIETEKPMKPLPEKTVTQTEVPLAPPPAPHSAPPTDLASYINAARTRRQAAEISDERENTETISSPRQLSADEKRMANIRRNLQPEGTSGVFQIISMGSRTARFSFRGWTTDYNNSRREVIEVDAGLNGDVERAIIRRMIELIRKHYKGNFNWESHRLNREIILSARMEDNEGLEDFLMLEFFGTNSGFQRSPPLR
ncbi:MAG: hypothetical protein IPN81_03370 [Nitrosomonadales bacterium]|nr:hypothetical protein [Nitrosomonadales bacterium]